MNFFGKRHLKLNPHHKQSVIVENKPITIINEGYSDDENINDREYQQLNSISWQQQYVFNSTLNEEDINLEYPLQHPDYFGGRSDSVTYLSTILELNKKNWG